MATITKTDEKVKISTHNLGDYTLVLHNDDYNTFNWVIECLIKICNHSFTQAEQCANVVHFSGKSEVKRGDKEALSKMREKLKNAGLIATIE